MHTLLLQAFWWSATRLAQPDTPRDWTCWDPPNRQGATLCERQASLSQQWALL